MMHTTHANKLKAASLALLMTFSLVGCGGGGGGSNSSGNKTLAGTLLGLTNAPLVGYRVVYDPGTSAMQTSTTDAHGQYKFLLSPGAITGSDSLSFYDAAGNLVTTQTLSLPSSMPSYDITTVAPPAPPPSL